MRGWFDAFRCDGGPTLYSFHNRTPVTGDVTQITFLVVFCTLYIAFLVIFPGIRKERFTTFTAVTLSLFVGAAILVSRYGSSWHVGMTTVASSYRAFSKEKIVADLGAYVGLNHVNVTLRAVPSGNYSTPSWADVDFNERFGWGGAGEMGSGYRGALRRGLPYPLLTVAEYFAEGSEGFRWGGQYRAAGYFASIMLWTCFASWILMNLLVVVVPRYGAFMMVVTGGLLIITDLGYLKMIPEKPLVVHLEGNVLHFHLGWNFWLVLIAGVSCIVLGLIITLLEMLHPHSFSTVLEVDYDTPYDRHVLIEDSHDRRFQRKKNSGSRLEEPPGAGLGRRILRRLSSKAHVTDPTKPLDGRQGVDNQGFELDPPKSPWRYPFRRAQAVGLVAPGTGGQGRPLRSGSQDSQASSVASSAINSSSVVASSGIRSGRDVTPIHRTMGLRQPPEKLREVSMW